MNLKRVNYSVSFKLPLFMMDQVKKELATKLTRLEFILTLHRIDNGRVLHTLPEMHNVA